MVPIGETVLLEKSELRLLCAIASKDAERPNINCVSIACDGKALRLQATDGARIVLGETAADGEPGCTVLLPLHVAKAAMALVRKDCSIVVKHDRIRVDDCVVRWQALDHVFPAALSVFDLPLVEAKRMPLFALGAAYVSDAKLLSDASGEIGLTVHAPLDDLQPVHIMSGHWHYVVMPMQTEETAGASRQLCLRDFGVVRDESEAIQ